MTDLPKAAAEASAALPRRLRERVRAVVEERDADPQTAAEIARAVAARYRETRVDPLAPIGTVSAQSIGEPGTQMTMDTFHYAGAVEMDVTQGLPRLIELVDARKEAETPLLTIYLEEPYRSDRERVREVVWEIEATRILALGDVTTNVAEMRVEVDLDEATLLERWPEADRAEAVAEEVAATIEAELGVETTRVGLTVAFGPDERSYRRLMQLVERLREVVFRGLETVERTQLKKTETDRGEEYVVYGEGSGLAEVLAVDGVDAARTTTNDVYEVYETLGVEAAREALIDEIGATLEEQGLGDVNVRHLMLVADAMTRTGALQSIGRHGISGSKESVLARAAFEVTVNHLLGAAVHGETDRLAGITENVIVGKPIEIGTGDVALRMAAPDTEE